MKTTITPRPARGTTRHAVQRSETHQERYPRDCHCGENATHVLTDYDRTGAARRVLFVCDAHVQHEVGPIATR